MNRLCTICARAGSKGVKDKNVREVLGRPLIAHTILQAKAANIFQQIVVSSDSDYILGIAGKWGADLLIKRPQELAGDDVGKLPVIKHSLETVEKITKIKYELIVDLDVTSPLREPEDIRKVVEMMENKLPTNVVSAAPARRSPYFNLVEINEHCKVVLSKPMEKELLRRQDSPSCFDLNASVYAFSRETLLNNLPLINSGTLLYEMSPERSLDIDTELDLEIVKFLMKKKETLQNG